MKCSNLEKIETAIRSALPVLNVVVCRYKDGSVKLPDIDIIHMLRWLALIHDRHEINYNIYGSCLYTSNPHQAYYLNLSKPHLRDQSEEVINELVKLVEG